MRAAPNEGRAARGEGAAPADGRDVLRHEVKFVAAGVRVRELEAWVELHPAGFYAAYPPRRVNNVYFDNHALFAFCENLVGASQRSKVRLRWYGETLTPERTVLEVKRRRNLLGWKLSYPAGPVDLTRPWREVRAALRRTLGPEARVWLDANPQAVLINGYDRRYYVSRDGLVRLTIDDRQAVYDQRFGVRPNLSRRANLPDTVVIEFKFAPEHQREGSRVMQGLPVRVSRNSKYVIGVQSLVGA